LKQSRIKHVTGEVEKPRSPDVAAVADLGQCLAYLPVLDRLTLLAPGIFVASMSK
jgi:hypothetical protein